MTSCTCQRGGAILRDGCPALRDRKLAQTARPMSPARPGPHFTCQCLADRRRALLAGQRAPPPRRGGVSLHVVAWVPRLRARSRPDAFQSAHEMKRRPPEITFCNGRRTDARMGRASDAHAPGSPSPSRAAVCRAAVTSKQRCYFVSSTNFACAFCARPASPGRRARSLGAARLLPGDALAPASRDLIRL